MHQLTTFQEEFISINLIDYYLDQVEQNEVTAAIAKRDLDRIERSFIEGRFFTYKRKIIQALQHQLRKTEEAFYCNAKEIIQKEQSIRKLQLYTKGQRFISKINAAKLVYRRARRQQKELYKLAVGLKKTLEFFKSFTLDPIWTFSRPNTQPRRFILCSY